LHFFNSGYVLNGFTEQLHFQFGDTPWEYLSRTCVSKSWVQGQGHGSVKVAACNSKTTARKMLRLDCNMCYDNTGSDLELLIFELDL